MSSRVDPVPPSQPSRPSRLFGYAGRHENRSRGGSGGAGGGRGGGGDGSPTRPLVLALVAVLALIGAVSLTWTLLHQNTSAQASPATGATTAGRASSPAPSTATGSAMSLGTPGSGPGLTRPGVFVVVRPDSVGGLDVIEEVIEPSPVERIFLTLPTERSVAALRGVHATMSKLSVLADGRQVAVPQQGTLVADKSLPLPARSTSLTLSYHLTGVSIHSSPGPANRVLMSIASVTAGPDSTAQVVVRVLGKGVRNVVCPEQVTAKAQLCGRQDGDQWTTPAMSADRGQVAAQVDLTSGSGSAA